MNPNLRTLLLIPGFLLFVSCATTNPFSSKEAPASKEIGSSGGIITSADGNLTLTFPAGALSSTETITITKIGADQFGPEFEQLQSSYTIGSVYELSPDGLEFDSPVHAVILSAQKSETLNGRTKLDAEVLLSSRNGVLTVLENAGIRRHTDSKVTVYGNLSGFSQLALLNAEYSLSNFTREDIEKNIPSPPGRTYLSTVSMTPPIDEINTDKIWQEYGSGLSYLGTSGIESVEGLRDSQGTQFGTSMTLDYQCTDSGNTFFETKARFTIPESEVGGILQNSLYEMSMEQVINCLLPEDTEEEEEYDFSISDLTHEFDAMIPNQVNLNLQYNNSPEIANNSFFKVDLGNGNVDTHWLTRGQAGPSDIYKLDDTRRFNLLRQIGQAGKTALRVEAWGYTNPDGLQGDVHTDIDMDAIQAFVKQFKGRNEPINNEWTGPQSLNDLLENRLNQHFRDPVVWGAGADFPLPITTPDHHVKIDFGNVDGLNKDQPAVPILSVERFDLGDNSWIYKLDYSKDLIDHFNLSPVFSYSEFPGSQPLKFGLNLGQDLPVFIQLDEFLNSVLIDEFNSYDPNRPTRVFITSSFAENLTLYDFAETTIKVPGHTLRIFKDGNGTGTVIASNNGYDIKECGSECSQDYTEGTTVTLVPYPDARSKFIRFSDNTSPLQASNSASTITIKDHTTVTATFMKIEEDDSDLDPSSITVDETGSILGNVVDQNGVELPRATVSITSENGTVNRLMVTNAAGRYQFSGLPKGNYTVTAAAEDYVCSRSGVEPILDPIALEPEESFRNFRVNFECVRAEEDPQEDETIAKVQPMGGGHRTRSSIVYQRQKN